MTAREHAELAAKEIDAQPLLAVQILTDRFEACRNDTDTLIHLLARMNARGVGRDQKRKTKRKAKATK
ncbi:MAG: hypothetical protein QM811_06820 [Pirellulales bacterium]